MSTPARHGNPWNPEEIQQLLQGVKKKETISEIASKHERTPGGIRSKLRQLAADYYFNDNRPLDEIMKFTGLDSETISDAISKRQYEMDMKEKTTKLKVSQPQQQTIPQLVQSQPKKEYMTEILGEIRDMMKEMLVLLKEKN